MIFYKEDEQHRVLMHTSSFKTAQDYGLELSCEDDGLEKAWDGSLWVKGYAPEEPEEHKKQVIKQSLIEQINSLDLKAIRPLRALSSGVGTNEDKEMLESIEEQAEIIRQKIKDLN